MTETEIIAEVSRLLRKAPNTRVADMPHVIRRYFKHHSYRALRERLGYPRNIDRDTSEHDENYRRAIAEFRELYDSGGFTSGAQLRRENPKLYSTLTSRSGGINAVLAVLGITPNRPTPTNFADPDQVVSRIRHLHKCRGAYDVILKEAAARHFGSFENATKVAGVKYRPPNSRVHQENIEYHRLVALINRSVNSFTGDRYTKDIFLREFPQYAASMKKYCINDIFSDAGYHPYDKPKVAVGWNRNNLIRFALHIITNGEPLNYTNVVGKYRGAVNAARELFGGWGNLLTECGVNYDEVLVDTNKASYAGRLFEDAVSEILADLRLSFLREPELNGCHPDFVLDDGTWIDAKLSAWTVNLQDCGTVAKYSPHTDRLLIVYLRGGREYRQVADALLVPVWYLIRQLPEGLRDKHVRNLTEIEVILD